MHSNSGADDISQQGEGKVNKTSYLFFKQAVLRTIKNLIALLLTYLFCCTILNFCIHAVIPLSHFGVSEAPDASCCNLLHLDGDLFGGIFL